MKSDKVLYIRFEKDFTAACIKFGIFNYLESNINSNALDLWINFSQMTDLFIELGFFNRNIAKNEKDQLKKIWLAIRGDPSLN